MKIKRGGSLLKGTTGDLDLVKEEDSLIIQATREAFLISTKEKVQKNTAEEKQKVKSMAIMAALIMISILKIDRREEILSGGHLSHGEATLGKGGIMRIDKTEEEDLAKEEEEVDLENKKARALDTGRRDLEMEKTGRLEGAVVDLAGAAVAEADQDLEEETLTDMEEAMIRRE